MWSAATRRCSTSWRVATLTGFGADGLGAAFGAAGALLRYAQSTQGRGLQHVRSADRRDRERIHRPGRRHPPQPGTDRNHPRPGVARPCSRCWTTAAPRWVRACCATGCTMRGATRAWRARAMRRSARWPQRRRQRRAVRHAWRRCPTSNASPPASRCCRRGRATWPACATACSSCRRLRAACSASLHRATRGAACWRDPATPARHARRLPRPAAARGGSRSRRRWCATAA